MAKRSSFGSIMRKKLSDLTNLQVQPKLPSQDQKPPPEEALIDQLVKLLLWMGFPLLHYNSKTIELNGAELQKLRVNLQKLQLQNWNLAQSNSHISAELNLGRERVKALQHELLCKDTLLKTKNMDPERKTELNYEKTGFQPKEGEVTVGIDSHVVNSEEKAHTCNRRRTARSRSMGPSTTHQKVVDKEKVENKRRCLRRQSARFKSYEREPTQNLFEIEDATHPVSQSLECSMHEDPVPLDSSIIIEEEGENFAPRNEAHLLQRSSIGRPVRKAVEKVESYREAPLKIKMRRAQ
ncbi:Shugoshin-1 [Morella rubra]|uniref:Shugoshin-1 n=1 Tax=Morella rubra TaxID=262757 RepID=A0A6A1WQ31_9ROSI|nr:Shugoshin-1 [Morella rubra]